MKQGDQASRGTEMFVRGYAENARLSDDEVAALYLKRRVEALSAQAPMYSRSAYTHRHTSHVAFANGAVKEEGGTPEPGSSDVFELAETTYRAIRAYRARLSGPAVLVWRREPEVTREDGKANIYARLCFEPDPFAAEASPVARVA